MTNRYYIGLSCTGHDNGLAILDSKGEVIFAEATERYVQVKRGYNTAPDDMSRIGRLLKEYCDSDAELIVAKTWSEQVHDIFASEAKLSQERLKKFQNQGPLHYLSIMATSYQYTTSMVLNNLVNTGVHLQFYSESLLNKPVQIKSFDHHLTHAAFSCYGSPFDEAICVIVDGVGEGTGLSFYKYKDGEISHIKSSPMNGNVENTFGVYYGNLCALCGFSPLDGEEWKVMGLAPYGKFDPKIDAALRNRLKVTELGIEATGDDFPSLMGMLEYQRKPEQPFMEMADLAHTGQKVYESLMTDLLNQCYELGISDNLVLGGGCALNSSYNGKILEGTKFKNLFVSSAPADDGNAVGAAQLAFYEDNPKKSQAGVVLSPYLGSKLNERSIKNFLSFGNQKAKEYSPEELCKVTAQHIADGKIIGWAQGRSEFGPRALGNRSILGDPRSAKMKDAINSRVKFREEFRPFAPSILHEHGPAYFENYQESPYMERTLQFKEEVKEKVPAVVHVDGTGRLQSVKKEWNPMYYALILAFYEITGIPILLNTSFNVMGKPIIHSVEDALAVFMTSGLDVLVINNTLVEK